MKIVNHKILTSAVLALLFSVAVSGGCGGSSSGHYYGNFGNSSRDVSPEPESQDVTPTPENPTSDDEYGGGNNDWIVVDDDLNTVEKSLYLFSRLNNTTWKITDIVVDDNRVDCEIIPNFSHSTSLLTFQTLDDAMVWLDEKTDTQHPNFDNTVILILV